MNYDFDLDYRDGVAGENKLHEIITGRTIEVKTDFLAHKSGNIAVEYEYKGRPSGIRVTKADYWAFIIKNRGIIILDTDRLKQLVRDGKKVCGGDGAQSKMYLIPISNLF